MDNGGGTVDAEVLRLLSKHLERSTAASEATRDEMQEFRVDMAKGIGALTASVQSYGRLTLWLVALAMMLLAAGAGVNIYFSAGGASLHASTPESSETK